MKNNTLKDPYRPKHLTILNEYTVNADDEFKSYNTHFCDIKLIDLTFREFDGCHFERVIIDNNFNSSNFVDCLFTHCDLSNSSLKGSQFHRVTFSGCKGIGTALLKSSLSYVRFNECRFILSNFSECSFNHVEMMNSVFTNCSFTYNQLNSFNTLNIDFSQSDFTNTSLKNCDFSSNQLNDISVSMDKLHDLTLNPTQAIGFAQLLGIKIKD